MPGKGRLHSLVGRELHRRPSNLRTALETLNAGSWSRFCNLEMSFAIWLEDGGIQSSISGEYVRAHISDPKMLERIEGKSFGNEKWESKELRSMLYWLSREGERETAKARVKPRRSFRLDLGPDSSYVLTRL